MALYTDIAAEIYPEGRGRVPAGVRVHTASASGIDLVRVDVLRDGLARKKGRYITLDMPSFARIDERNEAYVWAVASQLRTLLPREGLVLVAGIGNRGVTADALGPETADRVCVTRQLAGEQAKHLALRPVAAVAPGVEGMPGMSSAELLAGLVRRLSPSAVVAVDSLCTGEARRLGCSVQLSTAGLAPRSGDAIDREALGEPVVAVGVPTVLEASHLLHAKRPLVVTPRDIDAIVRRAANLLALAVNKALQPMLSVGELSFLTS